MISGRKNDHLTPLNRDCGRIQPTLAGAKAYSSVFVPRGKFKNSEFGTQSPTQKKHEQDKLRAGGNFLSPKCFQYMNKKGLIEPAPKKE